MARGGEVLAPGDPAHTVSFIDVRDLAAFMVHLLEQDTPGTFNGDGPAEPIPLGQFLPACARGAGTEPTLTFVPTGFLAARGVRPWADMPVWIPPPEGAERCPSVSRARAIEAGLVFRPAEETARDTLAWWREQPRRPLRTGLSDEREAEVLAAWHARDEAADAPPAEGDGEQGA
jgi:2'-hydroxyisoflavone reductase